LKFKLTISTNEAQKKQAVSNQSTEGFRWLNTAWFCFYSYKKCGKSGCKCATGISHGRKYFMPVNFSKRKPENDSFPLEYVEQVKECISNYRQFKQII